jgi:hypothetical protein
MKTILREPIYANWILEKTHLKGRRSGENAYDFLLMSKPGSRFTLRYTVKAPAEDPPDPS